jgi:DNA polymerase
LIVALGRFATQALLQTREPIGRLRGHWREYQGIPLMPTFHPAYLLRNPAGKRDVWEDMKQVLTRLKG